MQWSEFCTLISGLMPDTPLGSIIGIRAEKDDETIKNFNPEQRRVYDEWRLKQASLQLQDTEKLNRQMEEMSKMLDFTFGKGTENTQVEEVR